MGHAFTRRPLVKKIIFEMEPIKSIPKMLIMCPKILQLTWGDNLWTQHLLQLCLILELIVITLLNFKGTLVKNQQHISYHSKTGNTYILIYTCFIFLFILYEQYIRTMYKHYTEFIMNQYAYNVQVREWLIHK